VPYRQSVDAWKYNPPREVERVADQCAERKLRPSDPGGVTIVTQPCSRYLVGDRLAYVNHVEVGRITIRLTATVTAYVPMPYRRA
jgi:hypothetical protein